MLCRLTGVFARRGLKRARLPRWERFVTDIGGSVLFVIFSMIGVGSRRDMVCGRDRFSRGGRCNDSRLAVGLGRQYPVHGEFRDAVTRAGDLKHPGCLGR